MTRRCTSRPHPHTTRRAARTHRRTRPPFRPWPHSPVAPSLPFHSLCLCVGVRACVCVCACACAYVVRRCLACPGARAHTAPPSRTHLRTSRRTPPRAASPLAVHHTPTRPHAHAHAHTPRYFCVVVCTTVGYGDNPSITSHRTMLFTTAFVFCGVAIVLAAIGQIFDILSRKAREVCVRVAAAQRER